MKRKLLIALLVLEAAACIAFCAARASLSGAFTAAMAFPFEQLGMGLRALSLTGRLGAAAALALYAALSLLPAWFLLRAAGRRKLRPEDALLGVLSALLFAALYLTANPGRLGGLFGGGGDAGLAVGKAVLGGTVYSALAGYLILRALRLFSESGMERLQNYMSVLLGLLSVLFVWAIFGGALGRMLDAYAALRSGNVGNEDALGASYVFLGLKFLVEALPWALDTVAAFAAMALLSAMGTDRYSEETVLAAERLSRWCAAALAAVLLSNIGFNVLQLVFAGALRTIESSLSIPVISVAFVLAVLLFARVVAENRRLKGDNDLFKGAGHDVQGALRAGGDHGGQPVHPAQRQGQGRPIRDGQPDLLLS